jgi:hypothetical protein
MRPSSTDNVRTSSNGEEAAIQRFGWIPAEIFKSYLVNERDLQ